jgi:hypothetical protein
MKRSILIRILLFSTLFCLHTLSRASAANETLPTGAFIINMGVLPQTFANGLKPYGLVYDLIKNYNVPIKWVINPAKLKDGIDFTYNGIDYTGGTFIIPAEYRSATVDARIAYWQSQGIVGVTTTAPVTVPVYVTIQVVPNWTLDLKNGAIAQDYLTNAGIPSTAYNFLLPTQLGCCNDLFAMPHADPTWADHGNLLTWNKTCKGAIWAACHAVSVLENLSNPLMPAEKMNFLSTPTLINFGSHADGTPPYTYNFPTDPMMQFVGPIDAAQLNGSEQIYLPVLGGSWRPGAKIGVYDPTQANVPSLSPGPAATLVYGYAFDDPTRGKVMYEGGHSHNRGSINDVAAQRAFLNFSFVTAIEKTPVPEPVATLSINDTVYSNIPTPLTFSLPAPNNAANYAIKWSTSCGGTFSPNTTQQNVSFIPPSVITPTSCFIYIQTTDSCGRKVTNSIKLTIACAITLTPSIVTNPSCNGEATAAISFSATGGAAPYTYNWTRGAATGSGTGTTISNLLAGTYNVTVTSANGCSNSFTQTLTDPSPLSINAVSTNILCNGTTTGAIDVTVSGGVTPYTYNWGGGVTTEDRTDLAAGTYAVTVTDANGCTITTSKTLTQPTALTIAKTLTHIACFGATTGDITTTISGGLAPYAYNWGGGVTTQNRTNLSAGTYNLTVTDASNCTATSSIIILTQPPAALTLTTNVTNIGCGGGTGAINLNPNGGTAPFTYNWASGVTTEDRSGLAAGTYAVTVTDANGCTATTSATITQTLGPVLSTSATNVLCFGGTGTINLTVTGAAPYTYAWSDGAATEDRTGLATGTYAVTVTDVNGCTASTSATITTPSVMLTLSATTTNVTCNGSTTGAIDLTTTGGTAPYTYNWGSGNTTQDQTGLAVGTYTVTVTDANNCTATLSKTITQPNALALSTLITQVTCVGGTDGAIDLTVTGGTSPYTYAWTGGATTQDRTGLGAGTYTVIVTDANSCTATISAVLTAQNTLPTQPSGIKH